jgi:hypothetical protein
MALGKEDLQREINQMKEIYEKLSEFQKTAG